MLYWCRSSARLRPAFADGVTFVPLQDVPSASELADAIEAPDDSQRGRGRGGGHRRCAIDARYELPSSPTLLPRGEGRQSFAPAKPYAALIARQTRAAGAGVTAVPLLFDLAHLLAEGTAVSQPPFLLFNVVGGETAVLTLEITRLRAGDGRPNYPFLCQRVTVVKTGG